MRGLQIARVLRERFLGGLALGDIAARGVNGLLIRDGRGRPRQPANGPVLVEVAVLEIERFFTVRAAR